MLTPLDIENREFKRTMSGYNRDDVEDFMTIVLNDYEKLYKENFELKELVKRMDEEIKKMQEGQNSLKNAFLAAQSTADTMVKNAEEQAAEIVRNAQSKANEIVSVANVEIDKLNGSYLTSRKQIAEYKNQMESFLKSQLEMLRRLIGEETEIKEQEKIENPQEVNKTEE